METATRERLVNTYIDAILDNMSTSDLMKMVGGYLDEQFASYTDEELISEIEEFSPELLEV